MNYRWHIPFLFMWGAVAFCTSVGIAAAEESKILRGSLWQLPSGFTIKADGEVVTSKDTPPSVKVCDGESCEINISQVIYSFGGDNPCSMKSDADVLVVTSTKMVTIKWVLDQKTDHIFAPDNHIKFKSQPWTPTRVDTATVTVSVDFKGTGVPKKGHKYNITARKKTPDASSSGCELDPLIVNTG